MFRKIGDGLRRFMAGRYGSDRLNQCLLGAAFVLLLISAIGGRQVQWMSMLSLLAYVPLIWSMFRMYSRNIEARRRENAAFLRFFSRLADSLLEDSLPGSEGGGSLPPLEERMYAGWSSQRS